MNKKFVYQVGNNIKVILWCTANQISRLNIVMSLKMSVVVLTEKNSVNSEELIDIIEYLTL